MALREGGPPAIYGLSVPDQDASQGPNSPLGQLVEINTNNNICWACHYLPDKKAYHLSSSKLRAQQDSVPNVLPTKTVPQTKAPTHWVVCSCRHPHGIHFSMSKLPQANLLGILAGHEEKKESERGARASYQASGNQTSQLRHRFGVKRDRWSTCSRGTVPWSVIRIRAHLTGCRMWPDPCSS